MASATGKINLSPLYTIVAVLLVLAVLAAVLPLSFVSFQNLSILTFTVTPSDTTEIKITGFPVIHENYKRGPPQAAVL